MFVHFIMISGPDDTRC